MRSTGIVRRMDELGRVVIPKELRRTLRIREGEELEVLTTDDSELVLRKYSAIDELADFKADYVRSIYTTTGLTALITDNDRVLAAAGKNAPAIAGEGVLSKKTAVWTAVLFAWSVLGMTGVSTYLYFNF